MTLLSDNWIKEQAENNGLITPFFDRSIKTFPDGTKIPSYGLSSAGYDIRLGRNFTFFKSNTSSSLPIKYGRTIINDGVSQNVEYSKYLDWYNKDHVDILDFDKEATVEINDVDWIILPPHSFTLAHAEEHLNIPGDVSVVCMNKSTWARTGVMLNVTPGEPNWCFTGDTKVALANGTSVTFIEMVERYKNGERFFGYTIKNDGSIGIEELMFPRKTKEKAALVEVTLDNDEVIRCTPDHKFLTKNEGYVQAQHLKENQSLMPLYRYYDKKGYESVSSPIYNKTRPIYTHKLSDQWNIDHGIYEDTPNMVRHHVDFNNVNNYPTNIVRMTDAEHHHVHETKLGYKEERKRVAKAAWQSLIDKIKIISKNNNMRIEDIISERYKNFSRAFWDSDKHKETRAQWLEKHRKPRIEYRKLFDEKALWNAFLEFGSVRAAAKFFKTKAETIIRNHAALVAKARNEGLIPINHKVLSVKHLEIQEDVYCVTVPNTSNFALDAGVFVHNCGYLTLEISNTTNLPVKIWTGIGVVQLQFFKLDQESMVGYKDRNGKYQNQPKKPVLAIN